MEDANASRAQVPRLFVFFALAYLVQGFAQASGILKQPLDWYFKEELLLTPEKIAGIKFMLAMPWYFKPLYGLISDFLPIAGSRRRAYLYLFSLSGVACFALAMGLSDPKTLTIVLTITALNTAFADVVVDALMVEHGNATGNVRAFQTTQWASSSIMGMIAGWGGGQIVQHVINTDMAPREGVNIALGIAISGPVILFLAALLLVREKRHALDTEAMAQTATAAGQALRTPALIGAMVFLFLFRLQPGYEDPWYFQQTDTLKFTQEQIGNLSIPTNFGYLIGVLTFGVIGRKMPRRRLAGIGAVAYAASFLLDFLVLRSGDLLIQQIVVAVQGAVYYFTSLVLLSIAAEACPKRAEAFTFAIMMAVLNLSNYASSWLGATLYQNVYDENIIPTIYTASGMTLVCLAFLWVVPKEKSITEVEALDSE